jgi:N-formylglutamate amidohydrolase
VALPRLRRRVRDLPLSTVGNANAIMVEVNRGLYMDEETGARLAQFDELRSRLVAVLEQIARLTTGGTLSE